MSKTGIAIVLVSLLVIAAAYYMKTSADRRFDERTEDIRRVRKHQLETTGTEYTGSNFYLHPDPERKEFWTMVWDFSWPCGVTSSIVGGLLIFKKRKSRRGGSYPLRSSTED